MHADFNVQISIDRLLSEIGSKVEKEAAAIAAANHDPSELVAISFRHKKEGTHHSNLLPMWLILARKEFADAWFVRYYMGKSASFLKYRMLKTFLEESPESWDLKAYWALASKPVQSESDGIAMVEKAYKEGVQIPLYIQTTFFRLEDEAYNAKQPLHGFGYKAVEYDWKPESRYYVDEDKEVYYLSWDSVHFALYPTECLLRQEKHKEASECLFRLKHPMTLSDAPKHIIDSPRLKHYGPLINCLDYWLQARLESDPKRRSTLAWIAIYWLMFSELQRLDTKHGDNHAFGRFCCILGEFELLGDDQDEFLSHFKVEAQHASISFARKMLKNKIPMVAFPNRGFPTHAEYQKMYEEANLRKGTKKYGTIK